MKISSNQQEELNKMFGRISFKKKAKLYLDDERKMHIKLNKEGNISVFTKHKRFGKIDKYIINRKGERV